ncbi:GDP-L-fucose synthase [Planctomicrobium sp. SH527]|uniref:GDP-L-fucose synthase n=1 Tax=Planctomicrobium sp. SH527 TaxID=3448123 RepID=UPI003F5BBCE0
MNKSSRIYVAGHRGLVGSAIIRRLKDLGFTNLLQPTRQELDLTCQADTIAWFQEKQPEYVFLAAAKVGGILANSTYPADFIRENLLIQTNVISGAFCAEAKKLIFLGSSCIYPKFAPQPIQESALLTGPLEPTNQWYAIAKISGLMMCQAYRRQYGFNAISVMPTNLYGPGDNFDLVNSHVLPALIRKFHTAKTNGDPSVVVWGTGTPRREFLHVDDLADAVIFLAENYDEEELVNIGPGYDVTIAELAEMVKEIVGYQGTILFDESKPDGTPRKLMDSSRLSSLGWKPKRNLCEGLQSTYEWFLSQTESNANAIRWESEVPVSA